MLFINNIIHLLKMNIEPQYKWVIYFDNLLEDYILELINLFVMNTIFIESTAVESLKSMLIWLTSYVHLVWETRIWCQISRLFFFFPSSHLSSLPSGPLLSFLLLYPSLPLSPFLVLSHVYHLLCSRNHSKL